MNRYGSLVMFTVQLYKGPEKVFNYFRGEANLPSELAPLKDDFPNPKNNLLLPHCTKSQSCNSFVFFFKRKENSFLIFKCEMQGSKRDKTIIDKMMWIPNGGTQNLPFCRLRLVFETFGYYNQNSIKIPKVVEPTNKNHIIKLWGLV